MKQKKSILTVALVAVLIGAAFLFTACWQGTPAGGSGVPGGDITPEDSTTPGGGGGDSGGGNNSSSKIEGIVWKWTMSNGYIDYTLWIEGGDAIFKQIVTFPSPDTSTDRGSYTITGDIIKFTDFTGFSFNDITLRCFLNNRRFKYTVEGDTLTLSERGGDDSYQFKKE